MSNEAAWLERLSRASNYRDLQEVLDGMMADAASQTDPIEFARQIDEAISRLERERSYDQEELTATQGDYAEFRKDKSGFVGWLKRKMPFSDTRKQEKQHLEAIEQQQIEVAIDNFVIARAQMLKERILPSSHRRIGRKVDEIRHFLDHASPPTIAALADCCLELDRDLQRIPRFLSSLKEDLNQFADAKIRERDVLHWRDREVSNAKKELEGFGQEEHSKRQYRAEAVRRIAELLHRDLLAMDQEYRLLVERVRQVRESRAAAHAAGVLAAKLARLLHEIDEANQERSGLPNRRSAIQRDLEQAQASWTKLEATMAERQISLRTAQQAFESASRNRDVAKAAFDASKTAYESSQPKTPQAEVTAFSDFFDSPIAGQYARHKQAYEESENQWRSASSSFDQAKQRFESCEADRRSLQQRLDELNRSLESIQKRDRELNDLISSKQQASQPLSRELSHSMSFYGSSLQPLVWMPTHQKPVALPTEFHFLSDRASVMRVESNLRTDGDLFDQVLQSLLLQVSQKLLRRSEHALEERHRVLGADICSYAEHVVTQRCA